MKVLYIEENVHMNNNKITFYNPSNTENSCLSWFDVNAKARAQYSKLSSYEKKCANFGFDFHELVNTIMNRSATSNVIKYY